MNSLRFPNLFEKVLLIIGIIVVIIGYTLIQKMSAISGGVLTWEFINAVFLWLMVILLFISLAVWENIKEELKHIEQDQHNELKLIKEELKYIRRKR